MRKQSNIKHKQKGVKLTYWRNWFNRDVSVWMRPPTTYPQHGNTDSALIHTSAHTQRHRLQNTRTSPVNSSREVGFKYRCDEARQIHREEEGMDERERAGFRRGTCGDQRRISESISGSTVWELVAVSEHKNKQAIAVRIYIQALTLQSKYGQAPSQRRAKNTSITPLHFMFCSKHHCSSSKTAKYSGLLS